MSKKKLRVFVKKYLDVKIIGKRMFVEREQLETVLSCDNIKELTLNGD